MSLFGRQTCVPSTGSQHCTFPPAPSWAAGGPARKPSSGVTPYFKVTAFQRPARACLLPSPPSCGCHPAAAAQPDPGGTVEQRRASLPPSEAAGARRTPTLDAPARSPRSPPPPSSPSLPSLPPPPLPSPPTQGVSVPLSQGVPVAHKMGVFPPHTMGVFSTHTVGVLSLHTVGVFPLTQ